MYMDNIITNNADFNQFNNITKFSDLIDLSSSTVLECINSYIEFKGKSCPQRRKQYSQLINHLTNVEKEYHVSFIPVVIGDIFWAQFHNYLFGKGLASSTVNNLCSKLSAVLKWSAKYGAKISPTIDECYVNTTDARPKISLSQDEISRITYFDIDSIKCRPQLKATLKKVRDQFVIACYVGQRYSDVKRISPDCFKLDVFKIVQQKTGNTAVVDFKKIAAYPSVVRHLLEKYDYKAPYPHDVSMYNRYLHKLFYYAGFDEEIVYQYKCQGTIRTKTYKKYQLVSSHTARRSMITNAVQRGLNNEEIRRASGHKSESAFSKYILWNED